MRHRKLGIIAAIALAVIVGRAPRADIRILASDPADRAPHRFEAAVDLGVVALSVLVTWTAKRLG